MSIKLVTLENKHNVPLVDKILQRIGNVVEITEEDECIEYRFPNQTVALGLLGDNAIGNVHGAYMTDNDELVVIANYGDDGDWECNVNSTPHDLSFCELHDI
ncbi:MAG: hypothetical protein KAS32_13440 [Candidatus Peribacteraceae bacterium]|nr:hypothetical protein [Candidatus Peribacteraceae bacterium]